LVKVQALIFLTTDERETPKVMTKKNLLQIAFVVLLGGICLYLYRDRFGAPPIQISHRSLGQRGAQFRQLKDSATEAVVFLLNRPVILTSVKVFPVKDLASNTQPIWEMVADTHPFPVQDFAYGLDIPGMHPAVPGAVPGPLEPGVPYRVLITAGHDKAQHDFTPVPPPPSNTR
jgi:hypothetical protein